MFLNLVARANVQDQDPEIPLFSRFVEIYNYYMENKDHIQFPCYESSFFSGENIGNKWIFKIHIPHSEPELLTFPNMLWL